MSQSGKNKRRHASERFDCPSCGKTIVYHDLKNSSFYGCTSCHSFFRYENDDPPHVIKTFIIEDVAEPALKLGQRVTLDGRVFTVTGFMVKQEWDENARWREYVLFGKDAGIVMLTEFDGHWMYVWPVKEEGITVKKLIANRYEATLENITYELYQSYKFNIVYAAGEFDWNVLDDEGNVVSFEYIAPPHILVSEERDGTPSWYKGKYKYPKEIAAASGIRVSDLPAKRGIGAIEPPSFQNTWQPVFRFSFLMVTLVVITQFWMSFSKPEAEVLVAGFYAEPDSVRTGAMKPYISESFKLKGSGAVAIEMSAGIDNEWLELSAVMVNDQTGASYEFTKVLEYYHGYEGGESWGEGAKQDEAILSNVPSGTYHLNVYPASDNRKTYTVGLKVTQNPMLYSNLVIMLLLMLVYPVILFVRKNNFEKNRWYQTD